MPLDHPDWIFEPKKDGFRAVAYVEGGACRLVAQPKCFQDIEPLAQAVARKLVGRSAILDGEIVRPGPDGRPMFYELMRRRGPLCFYAFDLLWLDASDLRDRPLLERNSVLRKLLPWRPKSVLYVNHVAGGTDLFRVICDRDMEGVVAKQASTKYTPEATTRVKIKNRQYSLAVGREDFFNPQNTYKFWRHSLPNRVAHSSTRYRVGAVVLSRATVPDHCRLKNFMSENCDFHGYIYIGGNFCGTEFGRNGQTKDRVQ